MQKLNGQHRTQLTAQPHQMPAVQHPAVPVPAMLLAQLAPIVGPMNETEILQALENISPGGLAGDVFVETEIVYYEED